MKRLMLMIGTRKGAFLIAGRIIYGRDSLSWPS